MSGQFRTLASLAFCWIELIFAISISTDCKKGNNDPIPSVSIHRDGEKCAMGDIITVTLNITVAIMQKEDVYAWGWQS